MGDRPGRHDTCRWSHRPRSSTPRTRPRRRDDRVQRRARGSSSTTDPASTTPAAPSTTPLPWITADHTVRVGADVTLHRAGRPRLPQQRLEDPADRRQVTGTARAPSTFAADPPGRPRGRRRRPQARHLQRAELLQHHGSDYEPPAGACTYFNDRAGNPDHREQLQPDRSARRGARPRTCCASRTRSSPRSTRWTPTSSPSRRSRTRSRSASADRDDAVSTLVDALNTAAGSTALGVRASPADRLPPSRSRTSSGPRSSTTRAPSTLVGASRSWSARPRSTTRGSRWPRPSRPRAARTPTAFARHRRTTSSRRAPARPTPTARATPTTRGWPRPTRW